MLKNYFKIAIRNLWKNKVYSFITISGLSLGMAGAILLLLWIQNALSIDQFHKKSDYLYKIYTKATIDGYVECLETTPAPLASVLKQDYSEIIQTTRVSGTGKLLSTSEKKIMARGNYTDSAFLNMFSFPLIQGNVRKALINDHSIVITEKISKKLFSNDDPMNKTILVDNTDNYTISGVLKDLPNNTQFDFEFLLPWKNKENSRADMSWTDDQVATFAELRPSVKKELINNKITNVITRYSSNMKHAQVFLYPFSKVWLYGDFNNGKPVGGGIDVVHVFYLIALILLFIGSVNFMNLSTARSERRAKEVGVRKIAGADRSSLITQFIGESIMLAFIAGSIALAIAWLVLPSFNQLTEKHIEIEYQSFSFWIAAICFVLFTGILAGSYPAFYLSSFGVLRILKGSTKNVHAMLAPRKILVVMQFIISIIIINYCYVIQKQTDHAQNRDVGFLKNDLVFHPMTNDLQKNFELVKQELFNTGKVIAVNKTNTLITSGGSETNKLEWKGMAMNFNFELMTSDADFIKTNGLKLLAGRDLDVAVFPADTASCLVNETALKMIGYKNPIGQILKEDGIDCKIIGVIKDFLIGSPFQDTRSLMVRGSTNAGFINIRLNPDNAASNLKDVRNILKKYNPNYITELQFANDDYARKLKGAEITLTLTRGFAFIAIFISCLGLFGLGTFMAENRTNEIGVRKVLGASVASIAYLLTRDFIKLVIIAILIASPIAWLLMNSYLRGFSYRTNIAWWALLATGLFSIFIALMTVSFQAIKAAIANPVKSLRTE